MTRDIISLVTRLSYVHIEAALLKKVGSFSLNLLMESATTDYNNVPPPGGIVPYPDGYAEGDMGNNAQERPYPNASTEDGIY